MFRVKIKGNEKYKLSKLLHDCSMYILNGQIHREDGPAIEYADGTKWWFINGKCHREDGPAMIHSDGKKEWYFKGKRHREDGPAFENSNGYKEWYVDGFFINHSDI